MQRTINKSRHSTGKKQEGYILIELAIVFVVFGLLMATFLPFYEQYKQRNAKIETEKRMEIVAKAFSSFAQMRWRLPCPANSAVAVGTPLGVERAACNANIPDAHGIIPYRTLGLPEQYAKDGYGNFFTYVVSADFTNDNRLGIALDNVNIRLAHLVGGDNTTGKYALLPRAHFCAPLMDSGGDITAQQDGANLYAGVARDTTNVPRTTNPSPNLNRADNVTGIAVALISHGENGNGAYQSNGLQSAASAVGTAEELTSNNTNRLVVTESDYANTGANEYDDIVNFYTQDEVYAISGRESCEHL